MSTCPKCGAAIGFLRASYIDGGMHGYSEVLYAFSSSAANNGSAFAGLYANTPWYNLALGLVILSAAIRRSFS